jgi:FixJ family two-component response regulator
MVSGQPAPYYGSQMKIGDHDTAGAGKQNSLPCHISIVDDDASIREALKRLMRSIRFHADAYGSAEEFLASERIDDTACLILDVYLPGMNGFELQNRLKAEGRAIPIVFITAHSDEVSRQRALKGGAIDFLSKPVRREVLLKAIQSAAAH